MPSVSGTREYVASTVIYREDVGDLYDMQFAVYDYIQNNISREDLEAVLAVASGAAKAIFGLGGVPSVVADKIIEFFNGLIPDEKETLLAMLAEGWGAINTIRGYMDNRSYLQAVRADIPFIAFENIANGFKFVNGRNTVITGYLINNVWQEQ